MRQPRVGAALVLRYVGMQHRQAPHMCLVDDGVRPPHVGPRVASPVELGSADDDASRRERRRVAWIRLTGLGLGGQGRVQGQLAVDRLRVGIEEQFVQMEDVAAGRVPRAVGPEPVQPARPDTGYVAVPHAERVLA